MSRIPDLGSDLKHLPVVLSEYQKQLDDVEAHLILEGKRLEVANKENPTWHHFYDARRVELKTLVDYLECRVQKVRGKLFKTYSEGYSKELSDRAKDKYIDNEPAYLTEYELFLEVRELFQKYEAVVRAFEVRGYALNNITRARVSEVHDVIL